MKIGYSDVEMFYIKVIVETALGKRFSRTLDLFIIMGLGFELRTLLLKSRCFTIGPHLQSTLLCLFWK
jgi:hypothetical protein